MKVLSKVQLTNVKGGGPKRFEETKTSEPKGKGKP